MIKKGFFNVNISDDYLQHHNIHLQAYYKFVQILVNLDNYGHIRFTQGYFIKKPKFDGSYLNRIF